MLPVSPEALANLTISEQRRLECYKHRYDLISKGFTPEEVSHLFFLRWMHKTGRI